MGISDTLAELLGDYSEHRWPDLKSQFISELKECEDAAELRAIVEWDVCMDLPIELVCQTFEKILSLDAREPGILRQYSQYLLIHGPDWDDFAELLFMEADSREGASDTPLASILRQYPRLRWGDEVRVAESAPEELRPGEAAEVYGAIRLSNEEMAREHEGKKGE